MLAQYGEIKAQHPQELLLFRLGDFYELFGDDAREASRILEIVLTRHVYLSDFSVYNIYRKQRG